MEHVPNSQSEVEGNTVETNMDVVIKVQVKDKILCVLDMKLEILHFTLDLVVNHITKGISKYFI